MLRGAKFTWFPSRNAWGFQRHLRQDTRRSGIRAFPAAMQRAGRALTVENTRTSVAGDQETFVPGRAAAAVVVDGPVARLQAALRARADAASQYPALLPQPDELRLLARFDGIVSDDGRFFARQTSLMSEPYWELREATTGWRLTTAKHGLRDEAAARQGLAVLSSCGVDFAEVAEALAADSVNGIDSELRQRVRDALNDAHGAGTAPGGTAPVGAAYRQPVTAALGVPRQREERAGVRGSEHVDLDPAQR
jgi:hypothetical protein